MQHNPAMSQVPKSGAETGSGSKLDWVGSEQIIEVPASSFWRLAESFFESTIKLDFKDYN